VAVSTDVSEERTASIIMTTKIGGKGTLAVTSYQTDAVKNGVTSQKTAFFIVTAVQTSNLT
jgi:hypothetical protein